MNPPCNINFYNNDQRKKFAKALSSAIEVYPEMACLSLKKIWAEDDRSLYLKHQGRFTPQGHCDYWASIDAALRFWDKTLSEILCKRQKKENFKNTVYRKDNRVALNHHQRRPTSPSADRPQPRCKLPSLPPSPTYY